MKKTAKEIINSFELFLKYTFQKIHGKKLVGYRKYIYKIVDTLQDLVDGKLRNDHGDIKDLIINIPPRFGKSEIANISFMAWVMARNPQANFLSISSSAKLAAVMVKKTLDIINDRAYRQIAPLTRIDPKKKSQSEFWTEKTRDAAEKGSVRGVGAGGTITGVGGGSSNLLNKEFAGAIIIDDALQASDTFTAKRTTINEWFFEAVFSRRNTKNTPFIIIQQRLHHNDLVGYILKDANPNQWEVINIPAIDEHGEPLLAERMPLYELEELKRRSPHTFYTQYQQDVSIFQQTYLFGREFVFYHKCIEKPLFAFMTTDFAISSKENADYTCFILWYVVLINQEPKLVVASSKRYKLTPSLAVDAFVEFLKDIKNTNKVYPKYIFFENVAQTSIYKDFIDKLLQSEGLFASFVNATAERNRDKITRFREIQYPYEKYGLHLLEENVNENHELTSELFDVTNEIEDLPHDDIVDCIADAFYYFYIDRGMWDAEVTPILNEINNNKSLLDIFKEELRQLH